MTNDDDRLGVLSGLAMFDKTSDRNAALSPKTKELVGSIGEGEGDDDGDGDEPGEAEASRPSQATRREEIMSAARPMGTEPDDCDEDPRSPCARAREQARLSLELNDSAQRIMATMLRALRLAKSSAYIMGDIQATVDAWDELKLDLEGG